MNVLCKTALLIPIIFIITGKTFAAEITVNFQEPWELQLKTGEAIPLKQLVLDKDISGNTIVIFQRLDGSKGFTDLGNIENTQEFGKIVSQISEEVSIREGLDLAPSHNVTTTVDAEPPASDTPRHYGKTADTPRTSSSAPTVYDEIDPEIFASLLNQMYGNVCKAEINEIFRKTLKIDWTERTVKLHVIKVLGEIGSIKEQLYLGGVRYFQFPNDAGTYNIIDWKTGDKKSISDRAPYYFSN